MVHSLHATSSGPSRVYCLTARRPLEVRCFAARCSARGNLRWARARFRYPGIHEDAEYFAKRWNQGCDLLYINRDGRSLSPDGGGT